MSLSCCFWKRSTLLSRLLILFFIFPPIVTWSEADKKRMSFEDSRKEIVTRCQVCHVNDSKSKGIYPRLNGQHASYLLKELKDFKARARTGRQNAIMSPIAAELTDDDSVQVSIYFSRLAPTKSWAVDRKRALKGQRLWREGVAKVGIASCIGCHGPDGEGIPPVFPRLAGQSSFYVREQLKAFKKKTRTNDLHEMMQVITERMTDEEIEAVADFASGLR